MITSEPVPDERHAVEGIGLKRTRFGSTTQRRFA
jgi:hypothetical protein